ncbi:MAG TPA: NRDE family protein [Rhodocyclaceae bacterium]|nr:NRDE family protein [Rhodocyclaceae bacterium]
MCIILVAWRTHRTYPLVVAANRDEFFSRPTAAAAFWPEQPKILAGRDLGAGGTWLGLTRNGRFAALTNYRDPAGFRPDRPSRGQLVADFLAGDEGPEAWLRQAAARAGEFNGYNLLAGDRHTLAWFSNVTGQSRLLSPGIYGLSNDLLDTPWPKVAAAKSALSSALASLPEDGQLFDLLRDDTIHPDEALPRTGVSLEWERLLSAAFVRANGYGTRNSTVLTVDAQGIATFDEQTWLEGGTPGARRRFRFRLEGNAPS